MYIQNVNMYTRYMLIQDINIYVYLNSVFKLHIFLKIYLLITLLQLSHFKLHILNHFIYILAQSIM